jgi:hypothetical protein
LYFYYLFIYIYFSYIFLNDNGNQNNHYHHQDLELLAAWLLMPIPGEKQGHPLPLINLVLGNITTIVAWKQEKAGIKAPRHVCLFC